MSRWLAATMAAVLFVALVIAVSGFVSLFTGEALIHQADATPYLGPAMVVGGAVVVFVATAAGAQHGSPGVTGLVAAAASYLVMLGVGSIGYAMLRSDLGELFVFPAGYALGPFVISAVVIALFVVIGGVVAARYRPPDEPRRPHE